MAEAFITRRNSTNDPVVLTHDATETTTEMIFPELVGKRSFSLVCVSNSSCGFDGATEIYYVHGIFCDEGDIFVVYTDEHNYNAKYGYELEVPYKIEFDSATGRIYAVYNDNNPSTSGKPVRFKSATKWLCHIYE